jgi:biotin synthase-like enzyme
LTVLAAAEQVSVRVAARMIAWVRVFMPQLYPDRAGISARMRIRVGLKPDLQRQ